jgi:glycosyltransferase involved in cell wall biosynthesis
VTGYTKPPGLRALFVAPDPRRPGGPSVQAEILADALRAEGATVERLATPPRAPDGDSGVAAIRAFRGALREALSRGADVVQLHGGARGENRRVAACVVRESKRVGARVVVRWDAGGTGGLDETNQRRLGRVLSRVDRLVVPSGWHAGLVERRFGLRPRVVPDVVLVRDRTPPLRRVAATRTDPLRLLCTRTHRPERGIEAVLYAAAEAVSAGVSLHLTVAGSGPETDRLRQTAHMLLGRDVSFIGQRPRAEILRAMDMTDVVINGSLEDDHPLALAEAMASGVPVITTAAGGIPWLVRDGREGLVVPRGAIGAMGRAIARLHWDRRLLDELGRQAAARAAGWTWAAVRNAWTDAWGVACGERIARVDRDDVVRGGM